MLSQQEVADRPGTSLFTIQRIERGEGNVRPKTGRGVAAAMGIPVQKLLPKAQARSCGSRLIASY
jgi:transcriptional regulator with XRE-family HTH domain